MAEKKPDLSDLKARLGLTKPGAPAAGPAAPTAGPSSAPQAKGPRGGGGPPGAGLPGAPGAPGAPRAAAPAPAPQAAAPPAAQAPAPQMAAGPPAAGPAPTQAGPPAAARPAPKPAPAAKPAPAPAPQPTPSIVIDDAELETGGVFSGAMVALLAVCVIVGVVFGYAAAQTMFTNDVDTARMADAQKLADAINPKVAAFKELQTIVDKLDETTADVAAAEKMASIEFALQGNAIGGNRLLIGPVAIGNVTDYAADSTLLLTMVNEHVRMTTKADKDELANIAADAKVLENEFGVIFDYKYILARGGDEGFVPKPGTLVAAKGATEDKTKVKVEFLGQGREAEVELQGFIPINKSQILKSSGGNAMTRYQSRVRQIKYQTLKIAKYADNVTNQLKIIADGSADGAESAAAPAAPAKAE